MLLSLGTREERMRRTKQHGRAGINTGRLFLTIMLSVAMVASMFFPGGSAAFAEELDDQDIELVGLDLQEDTTEDQESEPTDDALQLDEEKQKDEEEDLVTFDDEDLQVEVQANGQEPCASVTAGGITTPYVNFADAVEAWKDTDGATLTLLSDVSGTDVPIASGKRILDLNGYGLKSGSDNGTYTISDMGEDDAQLTIVDSRPNAEHRYTDRVGDDPAVVDDSLTEGYKTFTGGYISSSVGDALWVVAATVSMEGITIIGCKYDGIYMYGGNLTAKECDIIGCKSDGVYATCGFVTMTGCIITGCRNEGFDAEGCVATLTNCVISNCDCEGVEVDESVITIKGCIITGCREQGVYIYDEDALVDIVDTTITGNTAPAYNESGDPYVGAGICVKRGELSLGGAVEVYNNTVAGAPSNLYVAATHPVTIVGTLNNNNPIGVATNGSCVFTNGLVGNGSLGNFASEMPEDFELSLTSEGEAQFLLKDGSVVIPAVGSDVLDLRNKAVGYSVPVYDAAGKNMDYGIEWDGTLTVLPPADKAVRVHGTVSTEARIDFLGVYADYGSSGVRRLAKVDGVNQTVDQTVVDDPMLLRFYSDSNTQNSGLDLVVEVVDLPDDHTQLVKHSIVCAEASNGAVTANRQSSYKDKIVTLTLDPDEGHAPKSLSVQTNAGTDVAVREQVDPNRITYTFVMPDDNVTVYAEFGEAARVTFVNTNGTTISSTLVLCGTAVTAPQVQTKQGVVHVGWQKDGQLFDLSTPIEEDATLIAVCVEGGGFVENFDRSRRFPKGWTRTVIATSPHDEDFYIDIDEHAHTRPSCVQLSVYGGEEATVITPAQDLSDAREGAALSFWYRTLSLQDDGKEFGAYYRVGEDGAWNPLFNATLPCYDTDGDQGKDQWSSWQQVSLMLPQEALVQNVQIGFKFRSPTDGSWLGDVRLDDVSILKLGHRWGYAVKNGATNVLVATCANGADACAVEGATSALTLKAKDVVYTGSAAKATVTKDATWMSANGIDATVGSITYFQGSKQLKGAPTQVGNYTAKVTVSANGEDFTLCKDFSITPKTVGLKWSGTKFTYNGKKQAPTATATGLVNGDKCTVTVEGAAKNAGNHVATATGLSNSNYVLPKNVTKSFSISKAKLTVTAKNKTIKFGAKAANAGVTYKGLVGKDTAKSLGGKLSYTYGGYKKGAYAGTYKIVPSGLKSSNYSIAYKAGKLTVQAPSSVAASTKVRVKSKRWVGVNSKAVSGTTGKALKVTALRSALQSSPYGGSVEYRAHWQIEGWQKSWTKGGKTCAPVQLGRRMEAIEMRLTSNMAKHYDVWYRVHVQSIGWMAWTKNGAKAGTTGQGRRLEAVQLVILPKGSKAPAKSYKGVKQDYRKTFVAK